MRKITILNMAKLQILAATGCLTQTQLARLFGISQSFVSLIVRRMKNGQTN